MVQTNICWTDWFEYYILCPNCASKFGDQWTGFSGDDLSDFAKLHIWNDTHEDAKTITHCERCKCELSGDVYQKTFNPEPYPDTDSDLYDPEELTVPPMNFAEMSDAAIAQWIWELPSFLVRLDPIWIYGIWRSVEVLADRHSYEDPTTTIHQAIENLKTFRAHLLESGAAQQPGIYDFVIHEGDRHDAIAQQLKEMQTNEPL